MKWSEVTEYQKQYIKDNFWSKTKKELANDLHLNVKDISYICAKLDLTKLWRIDDEKLRELCDGTRSYKEIQKELPNRTRSAIEMRCQILGLNVYIRRENREWTNQEVDEFKKLYPIMQLDELIVRFNKTKNQINTLARTLNLYKSKETYNEYKRQNSIMAASKALNISTEDYLNLEEEIAEFDENNMSVSYLSQKYNVPYEYLIKKLRVENKIKLNSYDEVRKIYNSNNDNLIICFNIYKKFINGEDTSFKIFRKYLNEEILKLLFRYFLKRKYGKCNKDFLLKSHIGGLLYESNLESYVRIFFGNYYDFICYCFPIHKFKPWEFEILDVSDGFWSDINNMFWRIQYAFENLFKNKIINKHSEVFSLSHEVIIEYFSNALYHRFNFNEIIIDYLNFNNIKYDLSNTLIYDNYRFDSKEELQVYKITKSLGYDIQKLNKTNKYYNEKYHENYIPDFIINFHDKEIIVEYFGLFKRNPNGDYQTNYHRKTIRKIEFYNKNYNFLPIFPNTKGEYFSVKSIKQQINDYFERW